MREVFDRYPHVSRTLYLVDEEFIGRGADAVPRALAVTDVLHEAGFAWETSGRIDQVVRLDTDRAWHLDRARMWRALCEQETTSEQNALAIRTLACPPVTPTSPSTT